MCLAPAPLYKARPEATPIRKSDDSSVAPHSGGWAPPTARGKGRGRGVPPWAAGHLPGFLLPQSF